MSVKTELDNIRSIKKESDFTPEAAQIACVLFGVAELGPKIGEFIKEGNYIQAASDLLENLWPNIIWLRVDKEGNPYKLPATGQIGTPATKEALKVTSIQLREYDSGKIVAAEDSISAAIGIFAAMYEYKLANPN